MLVSSTSLHRLFDEQQGADGAGRRLAPEILRLASGHPRLHMGVCLPERAAIHLVMPADADAATATALLLSALCDWAAQTRDDCVARALLVQVAREAYGFEPSPYGLLDHGATCVKLPGRQ